MSLNSEELELAYTYIVLIYFKKVIEKDLEGVGSSGKVLKYPTVYLDLLRVIGEDTSGELREVKRAMNKIGLSVYKTKGDDLMITYHCFSQSGKQKLSILKYVLKNQVEVRYRKKLNLPYLDLREEY